MPLINLIQEQRVSAKKGEAKARILFFSFIVVTAISFLAFGFLMFETDSLVRQEATLMAQTQKLQPIVAKIESDEKAFSELQPRLRTLEDAVLATDKWTSILKHLSVQTPKNTWLTGIRCIGQDPTKPISVSFVGMSTEQQLIGEFIMRLQNCEMLENVNLKFTQEKIVDRGNALEFEITGDIVKSQDEKPKEEKPA